MGKTITLKGSSISGLSYFVKNEIRTPTLGHKIKIEYPHNYFLAVLDCFLCFNISSSLIAEV